MRYDWTAIEWSSNKGLYVCYFWWWAKYWFENQEKWHWWKPTNWFGVHSITMTNHSQCRTHITVITVNRTLPPSFHFTHCLKSVSHCFYRSASICRKSNDTILQTLRIHFSSVDVEYMYWLWDGKPKCAHIFARHLICLQTLVKTIVRIRLKQYNQNICTRPHTKLRAKTHELLRL